MTDTIGPFDTTSWSQAQWYRFANMWAPSGVLGTPVNGSASGGLAFTASGLAASIGDGRAAIRGSGFERVGGGPTVSVPANTNGSLSRRDRIVLRRDVAAKTIAPVLIQGTPASTPVAPTVQRNDSGQWDLPLFSFLVPPSSGTTLGGIIDERAWVDPNASAPVSVWDSKGLAALSEFGDASVGAIAYTAVDGRRNQWESTAWHRLPTAGLVFSNLTARDAWFGSNNPPVAGDSCVCLGTQMVHDGTKWRFTLTGTNAQVNSDANGFIAIPHGGGQAPVGWGIWPGYQANDLLNGIVQILSSSNAGDSTVLGGRVIRTDTNTYISPSLIVANWMARF